MPKITITNYTAADLDRRIKELEARDWTLKSRVVVSTEYIKARGVRYIAKLEKEDRTH